MDIHPVTKGHVLVAPRAHHDQITKTPLPLLQKLISVVQRVAHAQVTGLKADGINVTQANGAIAGQVIGHIHFHVIPRWAADTHSWNNPQEKYDSDTEANEYADAMRKAL